MISRLFSPVRRGIGHKEAKTTVIYPHVLNRCAKDVKSPVDDVQSGERRVLYRNHTFPCVHCRALFSALQIQALGQRCPRRLVPQSRNPKVL